MEKNTNALETFRQFGEAELKNHLAELNTRYQNEALGSRELLQQAYEEHQKIYSNELDKKIQSLLQQDNPWLKGELENVKHQYMNKLSPQ